MLRRLPRIAMAAALLASVPGLLTAQQLPPELQGCIAETNAGHPDQVVVQGFPSAPGARIETAWCVLWENGGRKGLRIGEAWFKRKASEPWMQVLGRAGLVEVFVPYHSGDPDLRLYDLQFGFMKELHAPAAGPFGTLLGSPKKIVVKEVRDRGVAWTSDHEIRRGEELRLWGVYDASNYEYVIQYGFWDDGQITFRVGATGYNNPNVPTEGHMHTALWRIDVDLDGPDGDSAAFAHHLERDLFGNGQPTYSATDLLSGQGIEMQEVWDPELFTTLRVEDTQRKNANGHQIGYELVPVRSGTARHVEPFSHQDFRVTRFHAGEVDVEADQVPAFVNLESIHGENVVLWHTSSVHHDPHDEDGRLTLLRESGFDLVPHDLFDTTPLVDTSCPSSRAPNSILQDYEIVRRISGFISTATTLVAPCPAGKSLLGGGARLLSVPNGSGLNGSFPFGFGTDPTQWMAQARQIVPNPGASWRLESYAICGKVSSRRAVPVIRPANDNPFIPLAAQCAYGEAVLGGGGRSSHPAAGLTTTAPAGPVCPVEWFADARKVPRTDDISTTNRAAVICGTVPGYEVVTTLSARNSVGLKNGTALCPPGKVVVGGGAAILGDSTNTVLRMSWPRSVSRPGEGWGAQALELQANPGDWQLQVTAICACYPGPC